MYHPASAVFDHPEYIVLRDPVHEAGTAGSGIPGYSGHRTFTVNDLRHAVLGLPGGFSIKEITNIMTNSLHSCGNIILLIAGGGMLRFILQNSGIGELFGNFVGSLPLPMVLVAFLVAAVVRISVGSATVSMTMAAGIIASMPMVSGFSQLQLATITIAIAAGGTAFSHVNDSGFWLSKSLFEVDEKTNLKTWTAMETIVGIVGVIGATIVWFVVS